MAIKVDNPDSLSKEDIKNILINTFNRTAEKSVSKASYDKTILATIQYCSDATIGQYKVKYQNSYFTAYSKDLSKIYSNNTTVYISVPGNDMSNRMFIIGLANDDVNQQSSVTNLELDQQFTNKSPNFINMGGTDLDELSMSSYWNAPNEFVKDLYRYTRETNIIDVRNDTFLNYVNQLDVPYFRFGCCFKTDLIDERKSGNYGIRLKLKFKGEDNYKIYEISTLNMIGSPFNFTTFVPQYNIWSIDKENFERVESIEEFMEYFPGYEGDPDKDLDIFLKDITLNTCQQVYEASNDNSVKVVVTHDEGNVFGDERRDSLIGDVYTELPFEGHLLDKGNEVTNENGLEVYWGKEDSTVNLASHSKYNSALGIGWYCLNTADRVKDAGDTVEDLKTPENDQISPSDTSFKQGEFTWNSQKEIILNQSFFLGKETRLKCAIRYNNHIYDTIVKVINKNGLYLLLAAEDDKKSFYNNNGLSTLVAGVFSDGEGAERPIPHIFEGTTIVDGVSKHYTVTYKWTKQDAYNNKQTLPIVNTENYPNSPLDKYDNPWSKDHDNVEISESDVQTYFDTYFNTQVRSDGYSLAQIAAMCRQRYDYYINKYNKLLSDKNADATQKTRCHNRLYGSSNVTGIVPANKARISNRYKSTEKNADGAYILGPTELQGIYDEAKIANDGDYRNYYNYASIDNNSINHRYVGTIGYNASKTNTLYKVNGAYVNQYIDISVTAFITIDNQLPQSLETKTIRLTNISGNNLNYYLQITNGQQTFMYDESGKLTNGSEYLPLSFKLYDQSGDLLFDSADTSTAKENINLTTLAPKWRFPHTDTLLSTKYRPNSEVEATVNNISCYEASDGRYVLQNELSFTEYSAKNIFNHDYKDNGNIELEISYDNSIITASTDFNYIKQGEMGTNGTDYSLIVKDYDYELYKQDVLVNNKWSTFGKKYISPNNRFLDRVYLFATHCYNSNETEILEIEDAVYVKMLLSGEPHIINTSPSYDGGIGLSNTAKTSTVLQSQVFDNGTYYDSSNPNISFDWKFFEPILKTTDSSYPSSTISFVKGQRSSSLPANQLEVKINYRNSQNFIAKKPSLITYNNGNKEVTCNMIEAIATLPIGDQTDASGNAIKRKIHSFYSIPFFYFSVHKNGKNVTPTYLDPARHIVITGGYDEVIYDISGGNPDYNKQNPFKFYIYDENNNNITNDVLKSDKAEIKWTCSKGFSKEISRQSSSIPDFNTTSSTKRFQVDDYYTYRGKYYKCIQSHVKNQVHEIKDNDGNILQTYSAGSFVDPYWEQIENTSLNNRELKLTPNETYSANASESLLNNWVCLTIEYTVIKNGDMYIYNAQAFLPINILCNRYGSQILNDWNGKTTSIGVDEGYILTSKLAAGHKTSDNTFVGITMGDNVYPVGNNSTKVVSGIFGYGTINENNTGTSQTLFIDANTGKSVFGATGTNQIVLDPRKRDNKQVWSKLNGWYFSKDYLCKPLGTQETINVTDFMKNSNYINFPTASNIKTVGLYAPMESEPAEDAAFIWAGSTTKPGSGNNKFENAKFRVTYDGTLYAKSGEFTGNITATSGIIGDPNGEKLLIQTTLDNGTKCVLYHPSFYIDDQGNTMIRGSFRSSKDSRIGITIYEDKYGNYTNTQKDAEEEEGYIFMNHQYYPWHLPDGSNYDINSQLYPDKSGGQKNARYLMYNKNFSIRDNGETVIKGNIYAQKGRIGGWFVENYDIKSWGDHDIKLHSPNPNPPDPSNPNTTDADEHYAYIQVGERMRNPQTQEEEHHAVIISADGSIWGEINDPDVPKKLKRIWEIKPNGQAIFQNDTSSFNGAEYVVTTSSGNNSLTSSGLTVSSGNVSIGDSTLQSSTDGATGATTLATSGNLSVADGDVEITSDYINFTANSTDMKITTTEIMLGGATVLKYDENYNKIQLYADEIFTGFESPSTPGLRSGEFQGNLSSSFTYVGGKPLREYIEEICEQLGFIRSVSLNIPDGGFFKTYDGAEIMWLNQVTGVTTSTQRPS